jgi:hypothetical protein
MIYKGKYRTFNLSKISTYPLAKRKNILTFSQLIRPEILVKSKKPYVKKNLRLVAQKIIEARKKELPIIWIMGAHPIKRGLSPVIVDLMKKGFITHLATNGAGSIHDFEIALIGETSEDVPDGLSRGKFGMAYETGKYINDALVFGNRKKIGFGESIGKLISGEKFPKKIDFPFKEDSIFYQGCRLGVPVTVHASIGYDIIDQHPNFDGEAKGGTSGRDFLIFIKSVEKLQKGGIVLNIGSAIMGPEILLKSVSITANLGKAPRKITTAVFDAKPIKIKGLDTKKPYYYYFYFRDIKSVLNRIPEAFGGQGHYVQGDFGKSLSQLYQILVNH